MEARKTCATYQDVLDAPEHMIAELVAGDLYLQPRPAARHVRSASRIGGLLSAPFEFGRGGPGGWTILDEPELHLGEDVLVPDLAGWRSEAASELDWEIAYFEVAPQWVCEVLSPSTARHDRILKLDVYHANRIDWAWLVDPSQQSVEVFSWSESGWLRTQTAVGRAPAALEPFGALPLELDLVWPPEPAAER